MAPVDILNITNREFTNLASRRNILWVRVPFDLIINRQGNTTITLSMSVKRSDNGAIVGRDEIKEQITINTTFIQGEFFFQWDIGSNGSIPPSVIITISGSGLTHFDPPLSQTYVLFFTIEENINFTGTALDDPDPGMCFEPCPEGQERDQDCNCVDIPGGGDPGDPGNGGEGSFFDRNKFALAASALLSLGIIGALAIRKPGKPRKMK